MCPRSLVAVLLGLFLVGCSAGSYKKSADTQTYRIVEDTQKKELGASRSFSIEPPVAASAELESIQPLKTAPELKDALGKPAPPPASLLMEGEGGGVGAPTPEAPPAGEAQPAGGQPAAGAPAGGQKPEAQPAPQPGAAQPAQVAPADPAEGPAAGQKPEAGPAAQPVVPAAGENATPKAGPQPGATSAAPGATPAEGVVELQATRVDKYTLLEQAGQPLPVPESARVLSLADALLLASRHNRDYLSQQESLYLSALNLTLEQHLWSPRFRAILSSDIARTGDVPRNTPWGAAGQLGMALALPDGGNVDMSMNTAIAGDVTTATVPETAVSTWVTSITQPLLRGFGRTIAQEPLVQAERNVIYAVRNFERYRRTFAVQVASDFFRTLQQVDAVRNQWENYQRFIDVRKLTQALADAGRVPAFQVDQAHQDELSARNSWVTTVETYELSLDRFKIELGLPTEVAVILDYRELDALRGLGAAQPGESLEQVTASALANRLDLMVERDQLADVERRVNVAQDQLRGDLSLTASASIDSGPGNEPLSAQFHEGAYRAGLDYNLPVDRFSERNRYRQALISLEQQRRSLSLAQDTVVLEVRDDYRGVQQALESYRIQQNSLDLARRRVESTNLLLRAGRATTRDLLDSQNSYVDAQNSLTRALVDLFVARLQLRRDMDVLEIDEKGAWSWPQVTSLETGETKHE